MKHAWFKPFLRILLVGILIIGSYYFLKYAVLYLYPLLIATLFSLILHPPVSFLEKHLRIPRPLAILCMMMFLLICVVGLLLWAFHELMSGMAYLSQSIPNNFMLFMNYVEKSFYKKVLPSIQKLLNVDPSFLKESYFKQLFEQTTFSVSEILQYVFLKLTSFLSIIPYSMTMLLFILIATFLMTKDWPDLIGILQQILPKRVQTYSSAFYSHFKEAFLNFFKAQVIIVLMTSTIIGVGLTLLKLDHVFTIVFISAIVEFLPLIGTGIIFIPWIVFMYFSKKYALTISLAFLYSFVILFRQIFEPKILSTQMGIKPLGALVILFLGFQLWGIFGVLLAPLLLIFIQALSKAGFLRKIVLFIKG